MKKIETWEWLVILFAFGVLCYFCGRMDGDFMAETNCHNLIEICQ